MAKLPEKYYLRKCEIQEYFGFGDHKFHTLVDAGLLEPVHLVKDMDGNPQDKPVYRRSDAVKLKMEEDDEETDG